MFRANPSWNLSSDVSSSGMLQQGAAALLSLGAPCPSLPLVRPMLVCIFMFLLEHKAMENRDHGLLVIFGSQAPAQVCIYNVNQSIFAERRECHSCLPSPGAAPSEGTAKLSLDHHGEPQCVTLMLELQPHASALHWHPGCVCSLESHAIWKLTYTSLNPKLLTLQKVESFIQHNKWLSCAQELKVYGLGGRGSVMNRT